jgi:hypothetical protein
LMAVLGKERVLSRLAKAQEWVEAPGS